MSEGNEIRIEKKAKPGNVLDAPVLTHDQVAENTIPDFYAKEKEKRLAGGLAHDIENSNLTELKQRMENDTEGKSVAYKRLETAADILLNLKEKNTGARNDGKKVMDYGDALDIAEAVARDYKVTHTKIFHLTKTGRERYRISCRFLEMVLSLRREINDRIYLEETEKEELDKEVKEDYEEIIDREDGLRHCKCDL